MVKPTCYWKSLPSIDLSWSWDYPHLHKRIAHLTFQNLAQKWEIPTLAITSHYSSASKMVASKASISCQANVGLLLASTGPTLALHAFIRYKEGGEQNVRCWLSVSLFVCRDITGTWCGLRHHKRFSAVSRPSSYTISEKLTLPSKMCLHKWELCMVEAPLSSTLHSLMYAYMQL